MATDTTTTNDTNLDNDAGTQRPETPLSIALSKALWDAELWRHWLKAEAEVADGLLSPEQLGFIPGSLPECEQFAQPQPEDEEGTWAIGLAGHGVGNIHFCCSLRSPRMKVALCLPYCRPFGATVEEAAAQVQEERQAMCIACSMVVYLLQCTLGMHTINRDFPDACLTVVCEATSMRFIIEDSTGTVAEGTSCTELLERYLDASAPNPLGGGFIRV